MQESDKKRILNFLTGNETVKDFEAWLYYDSELESRIGSKFYFEIITIDYRLPLNVIYDIIMFILGKHINHEDFKWFKYYKILLDSGWKAGRKVNVKLINSNIARLSNN